MYAGGRESSGRPDAIATVAGLSVHSTRRPGLTSRRWMSVIRTGRLRSQASTESAGERRTHDRRTACRGMLTERVELRLPKTPSMHVRRHVGTHGGIFAVP